MKLPNLLSSIQEAHRWFFGQATRQINTALTLRNWVIGMYLFEYEQKGQDRAQYGDRLYDEISDRLKKKGLKGLGQRNLYQFKDLYLVYPQILQTVSAKLSNNDNSGSPELRIWTNPDKESFYNPAGQVEKIQATDPNLLINRLTFSHFVELLKCATALQRTFYETEAIANNWSVRELRRAMDSLLFERTGLSQNKQEVIEKFRSDSGLNPADFIRNPYILEFLGLEEKPAYTEIDLEQAIIAHLQKFLLEAGRGFCFEARQRRISFDNRHYRIDLVFYHRILKCHVLFDLKIGQFDHADAGQMNLYLNYYRENEMTKGDALPVGVILCAQKNQALVHYATGGLSQQIFVSEYLLNLPSEEELRQIVEEEQEKLG
jgi:predicted nuclease of restriction endonuclease-like (RecB) superfamily